MDILTSVLFTVLLASCVLRHVVRTFGFISDFREKAENRRLQRFSR